MKTRSIQTLLLAATLGLLVTACNNDSDQTVDITKPINVKLSLTTTGTNIPISRAAIGASGRATGSSSTPAAARVSTRRSATAPTRDCWTVFPM